MGPETFSMVDNEYNGHTTEYKFITLKEGEYQQIGQYSVYCGNFVCGLIVYEDDQKQGYGTKMLLDACARIAKTGHKVACLQVKTLEEKQWLVRFYQKNGFVINERLSSKTHYLMTKEL